MRKAVLITALPVERLAVIEHLEHVHEVPHSSGTIYRSGVFHEDSEPWDVLVAEIGAGNENAAAESERAIAYFAPEIAIFIGVAGGIKDVAHGDVVASSKIYNHEFGKDTDAGFQPRPAVQLPAYALEQRARFEAGEVAWHRRIKGPSRFASQNGEASAAPAPKAMVAPITAGSAVLTSVKSSRYDLVRGNYGDAVAVEMEGHGFLLSLRMNSTVQGLVVRGISDLLCDKTAATDDHLQPLAARHAAAFAFQVLAKFSHGTGTSPSQIASERSNRLASALRGSIADSATRWQAIGVARAEALALANDFEIGSPRAEAIPTSDHPLRLLTGDLGIGKSLQLERWHQQNLREAQLNTTSPVPIYIEAIASLGDLSDELDRRSQGLGEWRVTGFRLALDRIERAGPADADRLLQQARQLVTATPNSRAFLTSRPLSLLQVEEAVAAAELSDEEALSLVSRFAGKEIESHATNDWPKSLQSAIRRPLFAILVGLGLAKYGYARSFGILLSDLVHRVLGSTGGTEESMLRLLATKCVDAGYASVRLADLGSIIELKSLLDSPLIVVADRSIRIPIDLLTDWYAAEALARDEVPINALCADESRLERWRYPLMIAVAENSHEIVSRLLTPLAESHPAVASQIVAEAMGHYAWLYDRDLPSAPSAIECGNKIRQSVAGWAKGLGTLAQRVAPITERGVNAIGVHAAGTMLNVYWSDGRTGLEDVRELPSGFNIHDLEQNADHVWRRMQFGRPVSSSGWSWGWTLGEISRRLETVLKKEQLPVLPGPLLIEEAWHQARMLAKKSGVVEVPIEIDELRDALGIYENGVYPHHSGKYYDFSELRRHIGDVESRGSTHVASPWPTADCPRISGWSHPSELYSRERLRERVTAVYEAALLAYQQLVEAYFPKFVTRLSLAGLMPVRMTGVIYDIAAPVRACMHWHFDPLPDGQRTEVSFSVGKRRSDADGFKDVKTSLDSLYERIQKLRPSRWRWLSASMSSQILDVFKEKPATSLAYEWLISDLKKIEWLP